MANRVIKDSILTSPTLVRLKFTSELQWPRWLLMADDWGCFNANSNVIRGFLFPLRIAEMTVKKINDLKSEYNSEGLLFLWNTGDREWGYYPSFDSHHLYCNKTNLDGLGKRQKHRRKTPEPPTQLLDVYLQQFGTGLVRLGTVGDNLSKKDIPIPIPIPNPREKEKLPHLDFVFLTELELEKLITRLGNEKTTQMIGELNNHIGKIGVKAANKKYDSHYHTILSWVNKNSKKKSSSALTVLGGMDEK